MQEKYDKIIEGLQNYFKTAPNIGAVIGISGGLDSAVCLKLAVDALGTQRVTGLVMPESGVTSNQNFQHAKTLCKFFGIDYHYIPINKHLTNFSSIPWRATTAAEQNLKARIRSNILHHYAESNNAIIIGTSNKTDLAIGFGAQHGELVGDVFIIGNLYKSEVYEMAQFLELPDEFLSKAPSRELSPAQSDENELRISYKDLDNLLRQLANGLSKEELLSKGMNPNLVLKVTRMIEENSHKTLPPEIIPL